MTRWNVETVRDLLLQAGKIALEHFDNPRTRLKSDSSLVTDADKAVEDFLRDRLTTEKGSPDGTYMIGEESVDGTTQDAVEGALSGTTWVVDPIDGTAPYANGLHTWGISIGLLEGGRFSHGALFLPRTGELFITSEGGKILFGEERGTPETWQFTNLQNLHRESRPYSPTGMVSLPHDAVRSSRFRGKNPIQSIGSAVYSIAQMIRGNYIGYITRLKLWDLAGAVPILQRLGYQILFSDRRELSTTVSPADWNTDATRPRLWKARGTLYIAQSDETMEFLLRNYLENG